MATRGRKRGQQHSTRHNEQQRDLLDPRYEQLDHLVRETFAYDDLLVIDRRTAQPAGTISNGHLIVSFAGKLLAVAHIAWFLHEGRWPHAWLEIDHANRIGTDNNWTNLREATYSQNSANVSTRSKTGHKGVYRRHDGRYVVYINTVYHGTFNNLAAAAAKAKEIRTKLYGEFAIEPTTTGATENPHRSGDGYASPRKKRTAQQEAEPENRQLKLDL